MSGKVSKGRLRKPDNLQNHFNEEKRRKRQSEEKERRRREIKKCNDCILSFYNGYYGDHGIWPKKLLDGKVHLGITFSKIRLDICKYVNLYLYTENHQLSLK